MTKVCTKCLKRLPLSEFYLSDGRPQARCKSCLREYSRKATRKFRRQHPDIKMAQNRQYYQEHYLEMRKQQKQYKRKNKELVRGIHRKWLATAKGRAHSNYHSAKLIAKKCGCPVERITLKQYKQMLDIYKEGGRLTRTTGIPHHVHHIIPLVKGPMAKRRNLHVPSNLRILTALDHKRLHNRKRK